MPIADIVVESKINETFRVKQVSALFDVPFTEKTREEWSVNLPIENKKWRIGLILGPSGSGKTTIGRKLFGKNAYHNGFEWSKRKSILDDFPEELSIKDICGALTSVGFGSTPNWVRSYYVLSNGEKYRVELARLLLSSDKIHVIDEFTSVVDRNVAKICSMAIQKAIRRQVTEKQYVMLSCHYDIIDWLSPDWIYDLSNNEFTTKDVVKKKLNSKSIRRIETLGDCLVSIII